MGSEWYVTPEIKRLNLPNGEWIEVKNELTIGEANAAVSAGTRYVRVDDEVTRVMDAQAYGIERSMAFIVGWSARDEKGISFPFSRDALLALPAKRYGQILDVISKHIASLGEKEKNELDAGLENPGTEPSTS